MSRRPRRPRCCWRALPPGPRSALATFNGSTCHMAASTSSTTNSTGGAEPRMDRRLLEAAKVGDVGSMEKLVASPNSYLLLGVTPRGNTCLHISSMLGHEGFCNAVLAHEQPLLDVANLDGQTPLLTAVTSGHATLASFLLSRYHALGFGGAILAQDNNGCNALHHAIRGGHGGLALELIDVAPSLSRGVNKFDESPMYMMLMKNEMDYDFLVVFDKLLRIPDSAHSGTYGYNILHAAMRNGNADIAKKIMVARPFLAREENVDGNTPVQLAIRWNKAEMLRVLLEQDWTLGYVVNSEQSSERKDSHDLDCTLLHSAARRGHVNVARVLLEICPDAPYCKPTDGFTCLHEAAKSGNLEFVEFILRTPQLRKLLNMRTATTGRTALHYAVKGCHPRVVAALIREGIDLTILANDGNPAAWDLRGSTNRAKTLNWNEVSMLMVKADPQNAASVYNLHKKAKAMLTDESRKDAKQLIQTYKSNTSLVAILIATITFSAAFTLPGGYNSDAGSEGLPIMETKPAFKAFLISDMLAMSSSLAVAFICIVAKWDDLDFLLYYRSITMKLMWFAYLATTTAFASGLYTVLAPRLLWLAVGIGFIPILMAILTKVLGEWPIWKLRIRLGRGFKSEFLDMV